MSNYIRQELRVACRNTDVFSNLYSAAYDYDKCCVSGYDRESLTLSIFFYPSNSFFNIVRFYKEKLDLWRRSEVVDYNVKCPDLFSFDIVRDSNSFHFIYHSIYDRYLGEIFFDRDAEIHCAWGAYYDKVANVKTCVSSTTVYNFNTDQCIVSSAPIKEYSRCSLGNNVIGIFFPGINIGN